MQVVPPTMVLPCAHVVVAAVARPHAQVVCMHDQLQLTLPLQHVQQLPSRLLALFHYFHHHYHDLRCSWFSTSLQLLPQSDFDNYLFKLHVFGYMS